MCITQNDANIGFRTANATTLAPGRLLRSSRISLTPQPKIHASAIAKRTHTITKQAISEVYHANSAKNSNQESLEYIKYCDIDIHVAMIATDGAGDQVSKI